MASITSNVQEPADPDIYVLEYYHREERAKIPSVMYNNCILSLPSKVKLTDPVGNPFTVSVEREEGCAYFAAGWHELGVFYGLEKGGWITMCYTNRGHFDIKVSNLSLRQVIYPVPDPNATNTLEKPILLSDDDDDDDVVVDDDDDDDDDDEEEEDDDDKMDDGDTRPFLIDLSQLVSIVNKLLSYEELSGTKLKFSKDWSAAALPEKDGHLSLVDEFGMVFPCYYVAHTADNEGGCILRGWKRFYRKKGLYEGQGVTFGVLHPNSNVLYFAPH